MASPFLAMEARTPADFPYRGINMNMQIGIAPIIALIAGILILVRPRLLNYIVAFYLILIGLLGLMVVLE